MTEITDSRSELIRVTTYSLFFGLVFTGLSYLAFTEEYQERILLQLVMNAIGLSIFVAPFILEQYIERRKLPAVMSKIGRIVIYSLIIATLSTIAGMVSTVLSNPLLEFAIVFIIYAVLLLFNSVLSSPADKLA